MYLHTRLLFGIGTVTLMALVISLLMPLDSIRDDVATETDASMQLAQLLLDIQHAVVNARNAAEARFAAIDEIHRANDLRHVRVSFVDDTGALLATSPTEEPQVGRLTKLLLSSSPPSSLVYPFAYHAVPLGKIRVSSNPMSEFAEIEQRIGRDLAVLAGVLLAMGAAISWMVRQGLRPVAQVQSALTRLQAGHLETRLPHFPVKDIDDISQRFNQCAAAMQAAEAQRRDLNRRLIKAEEEERRRLARELHDELGQSLTAIKVDAAYIAREATASSPKIVASARSIETLSSNIMELIRSMLARLRPHGLETVGLRETLQDLVSGWQVRVADRFECSLAIRGDVDVLPPDLNITVYRLIQECLTNAVRYSRAKYIAIELSLMPESSDPWRVMLEVTETAVAENKAAVGTSGTGLLGMRERVEAHGGELEINLSPEGGLSLRAWLPVTAPTSVSAADGELIHA
jgi:two-component system sensor histidine kinase UhpB